MYKQSLSSSQSIPNPSSIVQLTGISAAAILIGVIFGLVAVTANPILVGFVVSLSIGIFLLLYPSWNIGIILTLSLFISGVLPIWVEGYATKIVWGISMLGFVLMAGSIGKMLNDPKAQSQTPSFVWVSLLFMIYCVLISTIQWQSFWEFISGFKRYFQMFGLLFALAWLSIDKTNINKWKTLIIILALIQLPWALYELIYLVPPRVAAASFYTNLVPIDVVAGTFGSALYSGGASGEMASFLIIMLGFALARWREKIISTKAALFFFLLVSAPLFLGETKVVILLLPLMFFLIFRKELFQRPHLVLSAMIIAAMLTAFAGYIYLTWSEKTAAEQIDQTLSYNIYDKGYGDAYLNRTTVITFWAEQQNLGDPLSWAIGNGLGSAHDASNGHISAKYPGYRIGLTALSTLLWDTGIVGTTLFLLIFALAWKHAGQLSKRTNEPTIRADLNAIQAAIALFAFHLIYRLTPLETITYQAFMFLVLGYLAWLSRNKIEMNSA
jgi:hypothetical protein